MSCRVLSLDIDCAPLRNHHAEDSYRPPSMDCGKRRDRCGIRERRGGNRHHDLPLCIDHQDRARNLIGLTVALLRTLYRNAEIGKSGGFRQMSRRSESGSPRRRFTRSTFHSLRMIDRRIGNRGERKHGGGKLRQFIVPVHHCRAGRPSSAWLPRAAYNSGRSRRLGVSSSFARRAPALHDSRFFYCSLNQGPLKT